MLLENIRRRCQENGITFWALERELGIGNGVVAKWSDGNPRVDTLKKVADFFGCTVDELLKED
jgi:transcriptional regulator with XRE-family HTH domain